MQQTARLAIQHEPHGQGPFVIPVRAVGRVRIRTRLRRARTDLLPLYIGAAVAGVACGFVLSIV